MLDREKIKSALNSDIELFVFDKIGSTNDEAEKIAASTDKPILIVAESQTNGKGRNGKSFFSPSTGLYFSLVTHPKSDFYSLTTVTCRTAVAVTRAIDTLTPLHPKIKWVNDIYIDGKKVCGILCRALGGNGRVEHLITGIGININTEAFPDEISNSAGSLNCGVDKNLLVAEIAENLLSLENYMDEYREKSCVIGKEIVYWKDNIPHTATAVDIDENGGLIVTEGEKKSTLTGGEITLRLK